MDYNNSNKGKGAFWFIFTAVAVGASAYLIHNHYKKKMSSPSIDNLNVAPSFEGKKEVIEEVESENIEQATYEPKRLKTQEIIFENAANSAIEKRLFYCPGMSSQRRDKLLNAIQNLNVNPRFHNEKVKIYNANKQNIKMMEKAIFEWALRNTI